MLSPVKTQVRGWDLSASKARIRFRDSLGGVGGRLVVAGWPAAIPAARRTAAQQAGKRNLERKTANEFLIRCFRHWGRILALGFIISKY
jgi:hypothetical protein